MLPHRNQKQNKWSTGMVVQIHPKLYRKSERTHRLVVAIDIKQQSQRERDE